LRHVPFEVAFLQTRCDLPFLTLIFVQKQKTHERVIIKIMTNIGTIIAATIHSLFSVFELLESADSKSVTLFNPP